MPTEFPIGVPFRMYHGTKELDESQTLNALSADADCDEYDVTIVIGGANEDSALTHNLREIAMLTSEMTRG